MTLRKLIIVALGVFSLLITEASAQCIGTLVWNDEFNGSSLDLTKWNYQTGNGCPSLCGWGNSELEYYTNSTNNTRVSGGNLILEVRSEAISGSSFSSGKILSKGLGFWTYGRFEARMRMPEGRGLWPAFWMLPEVNNWPTTGEIDIMEYRGDYNYKTSGALHYGNPWPNNLNNGSDFDYTASLASTYHIYAVEWSADEIRWYLDDRIFKMVTRVPNSLNPPNNNANTWPWNANFHILLNMAVGGWFTGTTNPADVVLTKPTFEIDYVRVYNMATATGNQVPYNGTPSAIPGKIEAEEFDKGCDQSAYYDTDLANQGDEFRGERADIEACTDAGAGYDVGWTATGEWMEYTVNVAATGTYDLSFRVASDNANGKLRVEMDNVDITGTVNVPNTGDWTTWQNVTATNKSMTAGTHILKVYIVNTGFNINYLNITTNTVMPVSLLSFTAESKSEYTLLNWTTAQEKDNDYFTVESYVNGKNWEEIGRIIAGKNSSSTQMYSFEDGNFYIDKIYYRLKQTDVDGKFTYSEIVEVTKQDNVLIAPNPFTDVVLINLPNGIGEFLITDLAGKIIETVKTTETSISVGEELSKGIYLLKLPDGKTYKLVKQ